MKWMLPVLFFAALVCTGCVERRIYLISDPPGADVYIDGEYVGQTRP
ncbi:MAG: PEGA domain-containing protein, partial [Planctomycetes bacterium]|nr:PEGA domain-containing protein [Planctomycetota bacterium]